LRKPGLVPGFSIEKPRKSWDFARPRPAFRLVAGGLCDYTPPAAGRTQFSGLSNERKFLMNKNELIAAVAEEASLSKADAQSAVDAVFSTISGELKKGGDVRLVGFGNFSVSRREASTGRNPQTGAEVQIPARNVPKFSAGKGLKDNVN
jgi:DNA-binding protein HU-beta